MPTPARIHKAMNETLREITPSIWIADAQSALVLRSDFGAVFDCTGQAPSGTNVHHVRPTGSTGHAWTVDDLDGIVAVAKEYLERSQILLFHCRRGVSRSPCAAAAVLLATGQASTVEQALEITTLPDTMPASHSVAGLRRWWRARQSARQQRLF